MIIDVYNMVHTS